MSRRRRRDRLAAFLGRPCTNMEPKSPESIREDPSTSGSDAESHDEEAPSDEDLRYAQTEIEGNGGTKAVDIGAKRNEEGDSDSSTEAREGQWLIAGSGDLQQSTISTRAPLTRGKTLRDVLLNVPSDGIIVRNRLTGGRASRDRQLSEAAALYGPATIQYNRALADDERDAAKVMGQIYAEFEARQVQLFCAWLHQEESGGMQNEENFQETRTSLGKVLAASAELLAETELLWDNARNKRVRFVLPPRFESNSTIDAAWTAAIMSVCARQISHQTGGWKGHQLPNLTVTDLMDIIAWVENFQDTMERIDADSSLRLRAQARRMAQVDLDDSSSQPRLFLISGAAVTEEDVMDGLAWVYAALVDLHTQAQDELLIRTRAQSLEWAKAAYKTEHSIHQTADGQLFTSLPEDIFTPLSIQLRTICDHLPLTSDVLPVVIVVVLSTLRMVQLQEGSNRLNGFERQCAAANDYARMGEEWEGNASEVLQECFPQFGEADGHGESTSDENDKSRIALKGELQAAFSELVHTFANDAVHAAMSVVLPVFDPIRSVVEPELFGHSWEDNYTQNELAKTLTATIEDFLGDLKSYLGSYLLEKTTGALISASAVFYIECLLKKAGGHSDFGALSFGDNARALLRISGDIDVMRKFFEGLAEEMPALRRTIEDEFKVLTALHELMSIAAGLSSSEASDSILFLHTRIRDVDLTRNIVKDLWKLMAPQNKKMVKDLITMMEPHMLAIVPPDFDRATKEQDKLQIPGLCLDDMVEDMYAPTKKDQYFGDMKHIILSKSGEKIVRGKAKLLRGKEKFAKATAKLSIGYSVRSPVEAVKNN